MKPSVAAFPDCRSTLAASHETMAFAPAGALRWGLVAACAVVLAGCAGQQVSAPGRVVAGRYFDPILGVWASPRLVEDGQPIPRGGGGYLVGRPYTIGGRTFVPNANPQGYSVVGTASWYGDAFHGRRTANGEVFDKGSISAAHPTLPLPSYVRVTNLKNGRSMIVRVNDRGPYHGGRVMDVSQRVAEALAFKNEGTGQIRIDYVGRASLGGSDDGKLLATLTTDGRPARLDGVGDAVQVADGGLPPPPEGPSPLPNVPARIASLPIFRRGRAVETTLATPVATPWPAPTGPLAPPPRGLAARPIQAPPSRRSVPAGRDPFYRPLFPAAEPRQRITFGGPAGRPDAPRRRDRADPAALKADPDR